MTFDMVTIDDQKIAYRTSAGNGSPVLLIHGNSCSSRTFQHQLISDLGRQHRLIAIDLPGFGDSQPLVGSIESLGFQGYGRLIARLVKALTLEDFVLVGWSLGGHVVLEAVDELAACKGALIYGTAPLAFPPDMASAFLPNPALTPAFNEVMSETEMQDFASAFFVSGYESIAPVFLEDIHRADGRARAAIASSIRPGGYKDEVQVVGTTRVPLAILHGDKEQLINPRYFDTITIPRLWRGSVQLVRDAGHAPHWEKPEQFNRLLSEFINDCR